MIKIIKNIDIFNADETLFLESRCKDFNIQAKPFDSGDFINYFYRDFLDRKDKTTSGIIKKAENFVNHNLNSDVFVVDGVWINKIDKNSNKDDGFHYDTRQPSLVIYLNEDFKGGEFQYIDENNQKIKIVPEVGLAIILNDKVMHRVLPVSEGIRYSLVFFFTYKEKDKKRLI